MKELLTRAIALGRHGALTRAVFGKPRGTRNQAAARKTPVPGHYYPGTPAWFTVLDDPLQLDAYLDVMQSSSDAEMREAAVAVVGEFGDGSCIAPLSVLLEDDGKDANTRRYAARALASIGGPDAEASLWRALESKHYPSVVREAALLSLLDLLTPDGWDNYNFMNSEVVALPVGVCARLLALHDVPHITEIVAQFAPVDSEVS